jgi:hypothetical protein
MTKSTEETRNRRNGPPYNKEYIQREREREREREKLKTTSEGGMISHAHKLTESIL